MNSVNVHLFRYADLLLLIAEADVETGNLADALAIVNQIRTRAGARAQGCGIPTDTKRDSVERARYPQCAGDARIAVPINDPSITWATYRVGLYPAFADQAAARTAVRYERRLELAMEGQRFFDLRRWAIADAVLNSYIQGIAGGSEKTRRLQLASAETFVAKHYLFPIPDLQLQLSKVGNTSKLTQNTGW